MTKDNQDNYVVVAGTFDLFHVGHVELLRRASKFGKVIALVNTDRFVEEFKGITPTIGESGRYDVVHACAYVSLTFFNDESDLRKTIDGIPSYFNITGIVFGDDYDIEKYRKQTQIDTEWQYFKDVAFIQLPRTRGVSSSEIRKKLCKNG